MSLFATFTCFDNFLAYIKWEFNNFDYIIDLGNNKGTIIDIYQIDQVYRICSISFFSQFF